MNNLRGRIFWALKSALMLFAVLVVLLFLIVPLLSSQLVALERPPLFLGKVLRWLDGCQSALMQAFVYLYVAFVGSCFASFLNVVAWRVPRGGSILGSSHCPACAHRLSMKDNVPVWGWLKNDGHCRHCQSPIAVRYIFVEVLLGIIFLVLFIPEITFGGINLPGGPKITHSGIEFVLFDLHVPLLSAFAMHATLMAALFTFSTISAQRQRIPISVLFFAVVFLVATGCIFPVAIQVAWHRMSLGIFHTALPVVEPTRLSALVTMTVGSAVGWAIGTLLGRVLSGADNVRESLPSTDDAAHTRINLSIAFLIVGLVIGWQSVLWVGAICSIATLAFQKIWKSGLPHYNVAIVMAATLLFLMCWNFVF